MQCGIKEGNRVGLGKLLGPGRHATMPTADTEPGGVAAHSTRIGTADSAEPAARRKRLPQQGGGHELELLLPNQATQQLHGGG